MKWILTAAGARGADGCASKSGIPPMVLMERAALSVLRVIDEEQLPTDRVLVAAGTGNNGGDGIAVARLLYERGLKPLIFLYGDPEKMSAETREQMHILEQYSPVFTDRIPEDRTLIIDALFGTGLNRAVGGPAAEVIRSINASGAVRLAVDIASGVSADTGSVPGEAVRADYTVTFSFGKRGHYFYPGASYTGRLTVAPIGITELHIQEKEKELKSFGESDLAGMFPRDESGNKGTFGKLLVIAGSRQICGAAYLASFSAAQTGIGMVRIFTEETNRAPLASSFPEALITTYREGAVGRGALEESMRWADAVLIGPGLGTDKTAEEILRCALAFGELPLVMDADALNLMAAHPDLWDFVRVPCVITPHAAEMSRISGTAIREIKSDPVGAARRFAAEHSVVCALKDARTVIAPPSGCAWLNTAGNSALAKAGSGDVLAGILAGIVTRDVKSGGRLTPERLARLTAAACFVHGKCGELLSEKTSEGTARTSDLALELHRFF